MANQTESFTATIGYDFDQMLNETVVPSRLNTNYHVLHTVQATKSQRADPPTNSSLPDKTMEDEPKVATFSVDRLHHSQLREPQLQIRLQLLATPICDYCKGFLHGDPAKIVTVSTLTTLNRSFLNCDFATTEKSAAAARLLKVDQMAKAIRSTRNTEPIYSGTIPAHVRDRIPHCRIKV